MPRKTLTHAVHALVLVALIGGSIAFVALGKTVTVSVDGHRRSVHTFARTVAGVLNRANVHLGSHDQVLPALTTATHGGGTIVVRRGRQLSVSVDGTPREVWTTARSVAQALDQLGVAEPGAYVSAARNRPIPASGLSLAIRLPHHVAVWVDGTVRDVVTTAPTVGAMLAENTIALGPLDTSSTALTAVPADGLRMHISRVRDKTQTDTVPVPFLTARRPDPSMYVGDERVAASGVDGTLVNTYAVHLIDKQVTSRTLVGKNLVQRRQDRIVYFGTKPRPTPVPPAPAATRRPTPPSPTTPTTPLTVQAAAPARASSPSSDGLNWAALAQCESGGDPRNVSYGGRYRGLYQFTLGSWRSVGGQGDPIDASPSEQTARAKLLYAQDGAGAWPVCGRHLHD